MTQRALILEVVSRSLYPFILIVSVWILLRGHNEPGGGFIGGLVAVSATSLLAVAHGSRHALARLPLGPVPLAALCTLVSLVSGVPAMLVGHPYMTHLWVTLPLGFTDVALSTVLLFDLGVFGAVWGALGGLSASMIGIDEDESL
jgi:multicomponent Na+:H+ antiporter subunit B